jgi:RNA polymerase sigma factor (sigma-70 family)
MPREPMVESANDRALALAALGGDARSLTTLIRRHSPTIRAAIQSVFRGSRAGDIDDVYQTVMLKLCDQGARVLGQWSGLVAAVDANESLAPYLARVARHCALDLLRGLRHEANLGDEADIGADPEGLFEEGVHNDPELDAELALRRRLARACLDALPSGTRAALRERIRGRPDELAARLLQIAAGAFRQRISSGMRLLAACVAQGGPGADPADRPGR